MNNRSQSFTFRFCSRTETLSSIELSFFKAMFRFLRQLKTSVNFSEVTILKKIWSCCYWKTSTRRPHKLFTGRGKLPDWTSVLFPFAPIICKEGSRWKTRPQTLCFRQRLVKSDWLLHGEYGSIHAKVGPVSTGVWSPLYESTRLSVLTFRNISMSCVIEFSSLAQWTQYELPFLNAPTEIIRTSFRRLFHQNSSLWERFSWIKRIKSKGDFFLSCSSS